MNSENKLKLVKVNPNEFGIEDAKAGELIGNLPQIKAERDVLADKYKEVILLDIEDVKTSKIAKELRLKIRDNRTKGIEIWHKTTKEFFLKGGQFVDAIKRMEIEVNQRMEENLEQIEKHFENKEKERKEALRELRVSELEIYSEFVPFGIDLGEIADEEYTKVFNGAKMQYEAKVEEERKAEAERARLQEIEKLHIERKEIALPYYQFWSDFEKQMNFGEQSQEDFNSFIDRLKVAQSEYELEQDRIRQENIRLAKEKAEAEKKAEAERKEAQKKIEAERKEKERIEAELNAKKLAEKKAEAERIAQIEKQKKEAEKLAKAPIKKQLKNWVDSFQVPNSPIENEKAKLILDRFDKFKEWANSEIDEL